jgi:uncharacterized protein (DUF1684 family)
LVTHDQGTDHDARAHDEPAALIERDRAEKDAFFRSSPRGPIPARARPGFRGLSYYPVDLAFRFEGIRLDPYSGSGLSTFEIPTSDGQLRPARRVGSLHFELDAVVHALTAYDLSGGHDHSLFVPFLDATSGTKTYGAGRYLDLEPEPDGSYVLDFNQAYHPYCAYSPEYSCPLTPSENRLPVRIQAGERLPGGEAGH